jgi:hypothetical protein
MYIVPVNVFGVIVAAIAIQAIAVFWYSPILFGSQWVKFTSSDHILPEEFKKRVGIAFLITSLGSLLTSYFLALLIGNLIVVSAMQAVQVALFLWAGFVAPTLFAFHIFSINLRNQRVFLIQAGSTLVALVLGVFILWMFGAG